VWFMLYFLVVWLFGILGRIYAVARYKNQFLMSSSIACLHCAFPDMSPSFSSSRINKPRVEMNGIEKTA
jgi:hypothetical protein